MSTTNSEEEKEEEDSSLEEPSPPVRKLKGDDIERPIGTKKFKRLNDEVSSLESIASTNTKMVDDLVASNNRMAARIATLRGYFDRKTKVKELIAMAKLYRDMGNTEKAAAKMEEVEKIQLEYDQEVEKEKEAAASTDVAPGTAAVFRKTKVKELIKMAKLYRDMGKTDKAAAKMEEVEKIQLEYEQEVEKETAAAAAAASTDVAPGTAAVMPYASTGHY